MGKREEVRVDCEGEDVTMLEFLVNFVIKINIF